MIEANRYKLGVFVIIGMLLACSTVFVLGVSELFRPKVHFVTFFKESIQGLSIGSDVKYKGVVIGAVSNIVIRTKDQLIKVEMEVFPERIVSESNHNKELALYEYLENAVKNKGLRCQLKPQGITGLQYIEIDHHKVIKSVDFGVSVSGKGYIPSIPSLLSGLTTNISEVLAKMSSIDYKGISNDLKNVLQSINKTFEDPKIDSLMTKLNETSSNILATTKKFNKIVTEEKLKQILKEASDSMLSFKQLSESASKQIKNANIPATTEEFRKTAERFRKSADGFKKLPSSINSAQKELGHTLSKVNESLDILTELITALSEDPSSLIRGKRKSPILKKE